ncbi:MAG: hypothetical protein R2939_16095 [Kofleriaceae bacterium]
MVIEVHPDAFYEGMYAARLRRRDLAPGVRADYEAALAAALAARYVAYDAEVVVEAPPP